MSNRTTGEQPPAEQRNDSNSSININSKPLQGFHRLAPSIFLYEPPEPKTPTSSADRNHVPTCARPPSLIILAGWMNAAPRHIAKYATAYTLLYPCARILLLTSSIPDMLYRTAAIQRRRLAAAVAVLRHEVETQTPGPPRVLLHLFSNGGARMACMLAGAFRAASGGTAPLPVRAVVLDSSPGRGTYGRAAAAVMASLPKGVVVRFISMLLVHVTLMVGFAWHLVSGMENAVDATRRMLNDPGTLDGRARRCYLYSKADRMVWWKDVEEHAEEAERKGLAVERVRFEGSAHASHVLEDGERYWGAVRGTWEKAVGDKWES